MTALSLFKTQTLATTLPNALLLSTVAPSTETRVTPLAFTKSRVGFTALPETTSLVAQGALASAPAQDGTGQLFDVNAMFGQTLLGGTLTPSNKYNTAQGTVTATWFCRISKYNSSTLAYTALALYSTPAGVIVGTTPTVITPATVVQALVDTDFAANEYIYIDWYANVTAVSAALNFGSYRNGGAAESLGTAGYNATATTTTVGRSATVLFNSLATVGASRTSASNAHAPVGASRTSVFNARAVVGASRTSLTNTRSVVGAQRMSSGNVRSAVGLSRTSLASTRVVVGTSRTGLFNTHAMLFREGFENAGPAGATLSTTNTGFTNYSGTGTKTSVATAHTGALAGQFTATTTTGAFAIAALKFANTTAAYYIDAYVQWPTNPTGNVSIIDLSDNAGTTRIGALGVSAAGNLILRNSLNTVVETSPTAPGPNQQVRVAVDDLGAGQYRVRAWWGANLDSATPTWTSATYTSTGTNLGTVSFGVLIATAFTVVFDDIRTSDAPLSAVTQPTTTVGSSATVVWRVRATVGNSRTGLFGVRATIGFPRTVLFNARCDVGAARTTAFNTRADVGTTRTALFRTRVNVGTSRTALFLVRVDVGAQRASLWGVHVHVATSRTVLFNTRVDIGASRTVLWVTRSKVTLSRIVLLNTRLSTGLSQTALWRTRVDAGASRVTLFVVRQAIGSQRSSLWQTRSAAGSSRTALFALRSVSGAVRTALFNVAATKGVSAAGAGESGGGSTARIPAHQAGAAGAATSTGRAAASIPFLLSASGAATSVGAARAAQSYRVTAGGSSASSASAGATVPLRAATATATGTSAGVATAVIAYSVTASGSGVSDGDASSSTLPGRATGHSYSAGSARAVKHMKAATSGVARSSGHADAWRINAIYGRGHSSSTGSAVAFVLARMTTARGSMKSSGQATASVPYHPVSATGSSFTTGSASARIIAVGVFVRDATRHASRDMEAATPTMMIGSGAPIRSMEET